jgi:hypothetical protein
VGAVKAQSDPDVGTWKLNVAKSKYTNMAVPKTDTRTIEKDGDSTKVTVKGVSANGSPIAYGYTSKYDARLRQFPGQESTAQIASCLSTWTQTPSQ